MDRGLRRSIVLIISAIGGVAGTYLILFLMNIIWPTSYVTAESYGSIYMITTAIPAGLLIGVWLDYFLKTDFLANAPEQDE